MPPVMSRPLSELEISGTPTRIRCVRNRRRARAMRMPSTAAGTASSMSQGRKPRSDPISIARNSHSTTQPEMSIE